MASITSLGSNSVILSWIKTWSMERLITVNFEEIHLHNCSVESFKFFLPRDVFREWFISRDEGSFRLFYCVDEACKNMAFEKFDKNGYAKKVIENFDCQMQNCSELIIISEENYDHTGTNEAFFVRSDERLNATIFFGENTKEIPHLVRDTFRRAGISTANGNFSLCWRDIKFDKYSFSCSIGNFREWVNLTFDYEPQNFILHSASGGQYLVLTSKKSSNVYYSISYIFFLTAFDARGVRKNVVKITALGSYGTQTILHAHIYEDEDEQSCVKLYETENRRLHVKCFETRELFMDHSR
ncbi:hypothetical protein QAD02_011238 [Eretmocerus hayati]|uniref:Uncharacterized protein n=1 Tax=Eretmocerus hayati TaxID=131215 RepID=A0ACC2NWI0_9HYME|nr:hypothetical protein QAD02_011238 [Eretmocerus hayati]